MFRPRLTFPHHSKNQAIIRHTMSLFSENILNVMANIMLEIIRLIFPLPCTNRTLTTDYNEGMKIEIFID